MISAGIEHVGPQAEPQPSTLAYLECRVREEANAAAIASSLESTMIHLAMATAYARRFGERSGLEVSFDAPSWADQHRCW